jgi:predicted dehydrogenase
MIFEDRSGTMINSSPGFLEKAGDFPSMFKIKLRNWIDASVNNAPMEAPGEAGLAVQKILDGVYRSSAAGGKEVPIK